MLSMPAVRWLENLPGHPKGEPVVISLFQEEYKDSRHDLGRDWPQLKSATWPDAANETPITARLYAAAYDSTDQLALTNGPGLDLASGANGELNWKVPDLAAAPVAEVGLSLTGREGKPATVYLDFLTWDGPPNVILARPVKTYKPGERPVMWRRAWVDGMDLWDAWWQESYRVVQNEGRGLLIQGTREWTDYEVESVVTPILMAAGGIGARVQGMRRYYALLLCQGNVARLVKLLDGEKVLAERRFRWQVDREYALRLRVEGRRLQGWIDGRLLFDVYDDDHPLAGGAIALVLEEGTMISDAVIVRP